MAKGIKCTCGHSWNKSDSSKKDMYVCHMCGKDNTMKDGGWLDNYGKKPNPNEVDVSVGPGFVGMGNDTTGRNYSPAWGGQFEDGGYVAQGGTAVPTTADSARLFNAQTALNNFYAKEMKAGKLEKRDVDQLLPDDPNLLPGALKRLNKDNLTFYRSQIANRNERKGGIDDRYYKSLFNLSPEQVRDLENKGLGQTKGSSEYQQYYRDLITPMQNLAAPFALIDSRIAPQRRLVYGPKTYDYPGGDVMVYDYDPLAIKPYHMRTDKEKIEWEKKYGKGTPTTGSTKKITTSTKKSKTEPEKKKTPVTKKSEETKPAQSTPTGSKKYIVNGMEVSEEDFLGSGNTTGGSKRIIYNTPKLKTQQVLRLDGTPETDPDKIRRALATAQKDEMAMGGSLPGAVGFTYARVAGSAPSNGKYAKKTKASAQNGIVLNPNEIVYDNLSSPISVRTKGIATAKDKVIANENAVFPVKNTAVNFMQGWMNSPMYKSMLQNSAGKQALTIDSGRKANLNTMKSGPGTWMLQNLNPDNTLIDDYVYDDRLLGEFNFEKNKLSIDNRMGLDKQKEIGVHELSHATDKGILPAADINKMQSYRDSFEKTRKGPLLVSDSFYHDYIAEPTETRARLNTLRYLGKEKGIYDPFTEKINKEQLNKFNSLFSKDYSLKQLREIYSDDQIVDLLNSVSKSQKTSDDVSKAENGKEMKFYQEGLDFKPNSIAQDGAIIDPMGQWAHPGEVTIIPGTDITMEGVDYPVLGISDTGDQQMMYPGEDYDFDGEYVTEYPMMKEGGWLSKFDTAQDGTFMSKLISKEDANLNKNRGDMASYFPEIKRIQEKPEMDKAIVKADQKRQQQILAEAVARGNKNRTTVKQDNRTPIQKEIAEQQLVNLTMDEAQRTSPLAQTFSSFTPTGDNPEAGKTAAVNFVDATPPMAMLRLMNTARDVKNNPYGIGQGNGFLANTLGTLGLIGDVFDAGSIFNPRLGSGIKQSTPLKNISEIEAIAPDVKLPWKQQELPGLHLSSTVEGGPISKIVEPKTGLVNVEQALGIIAKESGGASKANIIQKALGKDLPKKMDYNDFRKTVQDQLIPLDKEVVSTYRSSYGIDKLGYSKLLGENRDKLLNKINDAKEEIRRFEASGEGGDYLDILKANLKFNLNQYNNVPLENQTIRLSNKDKFGRGSDAHDNPAETLGHIHFIREAETPDVLTMTQMQSDAFQGTHRSMPKSLEQAEFSLQSLENIVTQRNNVLESLKKQKEELLINKADKETISQIDEEIDKFTKLIEDQNASNKFNRAEVENFAQKSLLDKNHQERYLQELVDYAGKRGDVNKVRVPTSETAAKVQGYEGVESEDIIRRYNEELAKNPNYIDEIAKLNDSEKNLINEVLSGKKKGMVYEPTAQTILKKYTEQPKVIKKLFGQEVKIVTDSKGNTWYEFDIPERFKSGKGEIKAFKDGGWLNKYK
jgi:hypothetical protein